MRKHFFIFILFLLGLFLASHKVIATVSPTTGVTATEQQIDNLKNRIASQVAQMNLVSKKGFIGTVNDISETQLSLTDLAGNQQIVDVDELTNFSSPSASTSFGISDIGRGTTVGVIGLYNKDSQHLLARYVDVLDMPQIISGGILSIDNTNYDFTIATAGNKTIGIDVEDITKTSSYTQAGGTVKSGFSKLAVGQRVQVVGYPDVQNNSMITASRVLVFPGLPIDPTITLINPNDIAPISTGSGKKLTPITK